MGAKFILYSLTKSRSERIVWLFEELGLDYDLKVFERVKNRAPKDAREIHPLGRFPIVEIYPDGDLSKKPISLTETGYICNYICEHYDKERRLIPDSAENQELAKFYSYYSEGSIQYLLLAVMVNRAVPQALPAGLSYLAGKATDLPNQYYYIPEIKNHFEYLDGQLAKQSGGYFAGDKLSYADIILSFPLFDNTFANPKNAESFLGIDLVSAYPNIFKWSEKIKNNSKRVNVQQKLKASL